MPVKRCRSQRFRSFGDSDVQQQPSNRRPELRNGLPADLAVSASKKQPVEAGKPLKTLSVADDAETGRPWPRILSLESLNAEESCGKEVGNFFRKCFLCDKRINDDSEVFMYSYLRAFCSPECRSKHIDVDMGGIINGQ